MRTGPSGILFSSASTAVAATSSCLVLSRQTSTWSSSSSAVSPASTWAPSRTRGGTSPCGSPLLRTEPSCRFSSRCVCVRAAQCCCTVIPTVNRPRHRQVPSEAEVARSRIISSAQIAALEALWRTKPGATLEDLDRPDEEGGARFLEHLRGACNLTHPSHAQGSLLSPYSCATMTATTIRTSLARSCASRATRTA